MKQQAPVLFLILLEIAVLNLKSTNKVSWTKILYMSEHEFLKTYYKHIILSVKSVLALANRSVGLLVVIQVFRGPIHQYLTIGSNPASRPPCLEFRPHTTGTTCPILSRTVVWDILRPSNAM